MFSLLKFLRGGRAAPASAVAGASETAGGSFTLNRAPQAGASRPAVAVVKRAQTVERTPPKQESSVGHNGTGTATEAFSAFRDFAHKTRVVMTLEQVPPHGEVLTAEKGRFAIAEEHRESLIAMARKGEDNSVIVLVERSLDDFSMAGDLEARLDVAGFKFLTLKAEAAVIRELYKVSSGRRNKDPEGATETSLQRRKFNQLIRDGIREHASDIQIHRHQSRVEVKFQVNGEWRVHHTIPYDDSTEFMRAIYDAIAADEKATAFNDRQPQDAVATIFVPLDSGHSEIMVRVRIHTQPEQGGFCMYLRILPVDDSDVKPKPFETFGYEPFQAASLIRMSRTAEGAILFVGTTGSGKTTSMHNCMLHICEEHKGRKNIITVEDPPEIYLPYAHQTFVDSARKDGGWGEAMRSAMRSVPDYVMVGEIRDDEPAQLVVDMTLSGHGLVSSLHAGDAFQTVDRLAEMGVRPSTLANPKFLSGIVYQRLLAVLCPDCKVPYSESLNKADKYETDLYERMEKAATLMGFQGRLKDVYVRGGKARSQVNGVNPAKTCPHCAGQGTVGRTVAAEVVVLGQMNIDYYDYFRQNRVADARDLWIARGGFTALHHGVSKVLKGLVDPHDIEGKLGPLELLSRHATLVAEYKRLHGVIPLTQKIVAHSLPHPQAPGVAAAQIRLPNGAELSGEATVTVNEQGEYVVRFLKPAVVAEKRVGP